MQDKTLSLTSFSKQRKTKREGECLPLHGINRFSRFASETVAATKVASNKSIYLVLKAFLNPSTGSQDTKCDLSF